MFGQNLKRLRGALGLSQADLAQKAGITQPAVAKIERGTRWPREDTAHALAAAVGSDLATLYGPAPADAPVAAVA